VDAKVATQVGLFVCIKVMQQQLYGVDIIYNLWKYCLACATRVSSKSTPPKQADGLA
jgi:hypothetical protein